MATMRRACFLLPLLAAGGPAAAFNGHAVAEGPLKLTIDDVPDVTTLAAPVEVRVTVANTGAAALAVNVRMGGLVDEWRAVGETEKRFDLAAGKSADATYRIEAGKGTLSALYPVHVWATFEDGGRRREAHAVRVFQTHLPRGSAAGAGELPVTVVPERGALALAGVRAHRAAWQYYDQPLVPMPVGWQGSAAPSRATFHVQTVPRGTTKRAIAMHPPWQPGGGMIFAEYRLTLPEGGPITLTFANAIRDHSAEEPASDGVTFRVWVGQEKLFERHTASKTWLDGQADLTRFAGRTVLLRLECHPGPKRNTTCDSAFWGEPVVVAGEQPAPPTEAEWKARRERARRIVAGEKRQDAFAFDLAGGCRAAVVPGRAGLADAAIAFGKGEQCVVFDGMSMAVLGEPVGRAPSGVALASVRLGGAAGRREIVHACERAGRRFDLTAELWAEGPGLRVRFRCPERITDLALGPADLHAPRVYYGHGYCIVEPEAFRAGFGGHNLSTSHVGFDFAGGVSLLAASDHPPDFLEVAPASRHYALHTHMDATLTFVPGTRGAFDCAVRYQPLYDKQPAGGFGRKAGRFVFDIWGGRYAEIAETMKRMISYGLTDSLLTVHVWQRWGYDYRLPDIHPPDPKLGTSADIRKIADVCKAHDIPWGLHDNYIDFYPDANGYSYDHICFTPDGSPVRAWLNESRDAQSYRWRPDAFLPFLKRNLEMIKRDLAPTHYFIDVFTSIGPFDYTDRQGQFHSFLQTRKCWGEAFAWIRDYLGGDAPTTSEAGHDQLTGTLDGADCQHLRLSPAGQRFCLRLPCKDWQRTPWFDAVLHDKFSLHGAGYSDRYQGGLPRRQAGIESDDYVSAEVLTGHALMIDRGAFGRGAVRKYWLAQDLIRSLATDRIAGVEFVGGDIHRQLVAWEAGAKVHVNRGADDWRVAGRTLPPFGYLAKNGPVESSIERIGGVIVEQSRGPGRCYVNGRGFNPHQELPIRPVAERVEDLGGGRFRLIVGWQAERPAPRDLMAFLHFDDKRLPSREQIAFQGDFRPAVGTSKWQGRVVTGQGQTLQVPDGDAREYSIGIGLWDPSAGRRYPLLGEEEGSMRYLLGKLIVDRKEGKPTAVRLLKQPPAPEPAPRWNVAVKPIDFGPVVTAGAVRCEVRDGAIVVTPLLDTPAFAVTIRPARLTDRGDAAKVANIQAVDESGKALRDVPFEAADGAVTFTTRPGEFAYRLTAAEVHSYGVRRQRRRFDFPAPGASPAKAASVP
ncbi:MAG TPA: hypothetical protein VM695_09020, partial [Phycisphaerae bacterium]|nr:hypothetical protein [Phycisphaerae bacterium]